MQKNLVSFYRAYWVWLEDGAPEKNENPHNFERGYGLCSNLFIYFTTKDGDVDRDAYTAKREMRHQFSKAGLDDNTPFNPGGDYFSESFDCLCHLNEKRIEWVKLHAKTE